MIDINGLSLSSQDREIIENVHVGGLILFSRNYESKYQLLNLVSEVKSIKDNIIIAVDHEGGRVQRFKGDFSLIPSMRSLGNYADETGDYKIFHEVGWLMSSELIASGIDISFAPVLDIDIQNSKVIGDRSFSRDHKKVTKYASIFIDGMLEAGMPATGKHFPGHGSVVEDSHNEVPLDNRDFNEIKNSDLLPFSSIGNKLHAVMCAHIIFPKVDKLIPSFSKIWLKDILRTKMNFKGLIFSDDLSMKGSGDIPIHEKVMNSLDAGCDMIIICNDRESVLVAIKTLDDNQINQTKRLSNMKKFSGVSWNSLKDNVRRLNLIEKLKKLEIKK